MKLRAGTITSLIIGSVFMQTNVAASAVSYEFAGNLTGTIGSTTLNGNGFDFVFFGDTANIGSVDYFIIGPTPVNPATSNSISISGAGSGTFLDLILVQNFVANGVPNFQDNTTLSGFVTGVNPAAIGWDLASSLGPLALSGGGAGGSFNTSLGTLTLANISNLRFTATVVSAPEPASAGLLGLGLSVVLFAQSRRSGVRALAEQKTVEKIATTDGRVAT